MPDPRQAVEALERLVAHTRAHNGS
jgi:hypothetical protein